ncbi:MAG: DUF512 domain-containing protein [Tissierellaceae bacterium]
MELGNYREDKNIIENIEKDSIADQLGIGVGDILLSVNSIPINDIIDYKYLISDEFIVVGIEKSDGEIWEYEIEKEYDEDLGIAFTNPLIDRAKSCRNKCMFCFIDQLPPNMRETLYFKDDDSRLSFLQGNFITLTNMSDEEIQRIIDYRLTPINVSVHTTNPELRIKMLNNKNAGKVYEILKRFSEASLEINCQIVLVPGVNDGDELKRTLEDLARLYPSIKSVAVVPVGITKYRENLKKIHPFDQGSAKELLALIDERQRDFQLRLGSRFVFASDEFFALIDRELPESHEYEGFPQLENGVGLIRSFEDEIDEELGRISSPISKNKRYVLATGSLAFNFMERLAEKISRHFLGLELKVVAISNNFFGHTITVSGLITGQDLLGQLRGYKDYDGIIIPKSMLKRDEEVFLDNYSLEGLAGKLSIPIIPSKVDGKELIDILKN